LKAIYTSTQNYIPEEQNIRLRHCEHLKVRDVKYVYKTSGCIFHVRRILS